MPENSTSSPAQNNADSRASPKDDVSSRHLNVEERSNTVAVHSPSSTREKMNAMEERGGALNLEECGGALNLEEQQGVDTADVRFHMLCWRRFIACFL